VCVVQVVGRADADVLDAILGRSAANLFQIAVESLDLGKEAGVGKEAVESAHAIVRVDRGDKRIARVVDRLHVLGRNEAGGADQSEIHVGSRLCHAALLPATR
jgi:hypothetical protein